MSERYPLSWPEGWKRSAPSSRIRAQFGKTEKRQSFDNFVMDKKRLSIADAVQRVAYELERMGVDQGDIIADDFRKRHKIQQGELLFNS